MARKKKKPVLLIVAIIIILLAALIAGLIFLLNKPSDGNASGDSGSGQASVDDK